MARRERPRRSLAPLVALLVVGLVLFGLVRVVTSILDGPGPQVAPVAEQCVVVVGDVSDSLDLEASQNAAIIVAEAMHRGLPPRAASIALATAMQESKLHNIDYGDRDSVGLFQQRPSQGWGTVEQIMDPWYSAGKFYDELVTVKGWESGDINDVAQTVQRSGVPDGYRKHVEAARAWASALTGHSPAAVRCVSRSGAAPDLALAKEVVERSGTARWTPGQAMVTLNAADATRLWSATQLTMATARTTGYTAVAVGGQTWTLDPKRVAGWTGSATPKPTEAVVTLRA